MADTLVETTGPAWTYAIWPKGKAVLRSRDIDIDDNEGCPRVDHGELLFIARKWRRKYTPYETK